MNFRPRRMEEPEINVVSLIDVVLMLVVFFMLSSSFVGEGRLRIRLPQAGSVPVERPGSEKLIVSVTASGAYLVNDRELVNSGPDTLRAAILKVAGENRGAPVSVRADGRASHQSVVTAMDVLAKLGFVQLNVLTTNAAGADTP
ncbi:MAG TPA: biopolymer transporter ExbD [Steroidobacteraceae bacterium]